MTIPKITICSGIFCGAEEIVSALAEASGRRLLSDDTLIEAAARQAGVPVQHMQRCLTDKPSVFNPFTRERERLAAWIKLALAEACRENGPGSILHGWIGHLMPGTLQDVLQVCLIADRSFRLQTAAATQNLNPTNAARLIDTRDRECTRWVHFLKGVDDPWQAELYDMVLPTHRLTLQQVVDTIIQGTTAQVLQPTEASRQAADRFLQAARIETVLAAAGHSVTVAIQDDMVLLQINRAVLMRERLEKDLAGLVRASGEMGRVQLIIADDLQDKETYRQFQQDQPSKVLLVDDEREFVQTLSERLGMRDIGSAVAFDGESALELVNTDTPEVMLLDLQMPGINGIEVLKQVKAEHPEIEVIILTGHGTDQDRALCLQLGAFAYLEKPVDIDVLSDVLKRANIKMHQNLQAVKAPRA